MQIIMFQSFAKRREETLVPDLSAGTSYNIRLKDACSVTDPIVLFNDIVPNYTYAYIPLWKRYYFVGDSVIGTNKVFEVQLHSDPMATFASQIKNYTCYVERAASEYDGTIIDGMYPATSDVTIQKSAISSPFVSNWIDCRFILGVTGENANGVYGSVAYYAYTHADVGYLVGDLYADADFAGIFQSTENPGQYIVSCMAIPYSTLGGNLAPYLGSWHPTHASAAAVDDPIITLPGKTVTVPVHPQASTHGEWVKHAPYTRYTLYFEPFGMIELDPNMIMNASSTTLYMIVKVDQVTGLGILDVRLNSATGPILARVNGQVGIPIAMSTSQRMGIADVAGAVAGVATAAGLAATQNYIGAGLAMASTIANALEAQTPKVATKGSDGSFLPLYAEPCLVSEFTTITDMDIPNTGRPLCKRRQLGTLSGFVKCLNANIPISGFESDKEVINAYLNGGAFIT